MDLWLVIVLIVAVGAVAGGLAGLYYGLENIPEAWTEILPKREWIIATILRLK